MSGRADRTQSQAAGTAACAAELCIRARAWQDAICLTQHGARAGLVSQLTGLEKKAANRLYRQLHGRPSPPGQLPFSDTWFLQDDRRMLHASVVWQLSKRFAASPATPARRLIDVYESYCWLQTKPLLDIMRVAFIPHLVAAQDWEEQTCGQCGSVVRRTDGQRGQRLLGLPALSPPPLPGLRRTADGPPEREISGTLRRLSAFPTTVSRFGPGPDASDAAFPPSRRARRVLRTCQMAPAFPDVTSPSKGYRCWQQYGLVSRRDQPVKTRESC